MKELFDYVVVRMSTSIMWSKELFWLRRRRNTNPKYCCQKNNFDNDVTKLRRRYPDWLKGYFISENWFIRCPMVQRICVAYGRVDYRTDAGQYNYDIKTKFSIFVVLFHLFQMERTCKLTVYNCVFLFHVAKSLNNIVLPFWKVNIWQYSFKFIF